MKKVAILVPTSRAFGRGIIKGVTNYARINKDWRLFTILPDYCSISNIHVKDFIEKWEPDGIIARIPFIDYDCALDLKIPMVVTHIYSPVENELNIIPDCETPSRMAAEYFISKGFKNFAFCGFHLNWDLSRAHFFRYYLQCAGFDTEIYQTPIEDMHNAWEREQPHLAVWLQKLPKPVAIYTTNDDRARHVLEACHMANLRVPEEVSVLGSDNDQLVCDISEPTLSSISYNFERAGYDAAESLNLLMEGYKGKLKDIEISPLKIHTRQSTGFIAIDDDEISDTLKFIKDNETKNITAQDVIDNSTLSRRSLEIRFKKATGRTISEHIRKLKLLYVCDLLINTHLTVLEISYKAGFPNAKRLHEVFMKTYKTTPLDYRKTKGKVFVN
ncbi:MAG: XylR family transcriptional regulator [Sedimentisphaeraceae bacterium JB056]